MNEIANYLENLSLLPQVLLIHGSKTSFAELEAAITKKIMKGENIKNNIVFAVTNFTLSINNVLKKQDVLTIINDLSLQSLVNNGNKICFIKNIEYSSLEASNSFLKFLENLPEKTYIVFFTSSINKVLPTIKSRCQILNYFAVKNNGTDISADNVLINKIVSQFITNDNNKSFNGNFLLIKELVPLKEKSFNFFVLLTNILNAKIYFLVNKNHDSNDKIVQELVGQWKNKNLNFLAQMLELTTKCCQQFSNKSNLNLLFNYFFINLYQE